MDPATEFSTVWVKMEVDEDGMEEHDSDQQYEETAGSGQENEESEPEPEPEPEETRPRRSRRKPAAPRKAKNVEEKIFQCEYCDFQALHKSTLNYHTMKHTNPTPIPCEVCNYTTNHPASLKRHMLSMHTDQNDPIIQAMPDKKCKDCDFTCKFSWKLFVHRRKHNEKTLRCDLCSFSTSRKSNFEKHCRSHKHKNVSSMGQSTDSIVFECDKCPFVTKHEGHIFRHLAIIHKEVSADANKCDFCDFSTQVRWRLNIHKKNSHQERPIKCEFCEFTTEYNCQYKLHKNQHLTEMALTMPSTETKPTEVYKPPRSKGIGLTDVTMEGPHTDKEFIVDPTCEEVDWRSIEVGEKPGQEKPFYCIYCPYTSKFKASVQRHFQRNHTSEHSRPYKCVHCGFSTKTRDQISLHSKRSKSNYKLTCKDCDFASFYKCQMTEHQKIHWQFKCSLCDFVSRINYDLSQHYAAVHLGQGMKCRYCNFQAARKGSLINHETTHTNKRFKCGLCDYSATRRNLLFNHMKKTHAGEKPKIVINDRRFEFLNKAVDVIRNRTNAMISELNGESLPNNESQPNIESQPNVESQSNAERIENETQQIECDVDVPEFKEEKDPIKFETKNNEETGNVESGEDDDNLIQLPDLTGGSKLKVNSESVDKVESDSREDFGPRLWNADRLNEYQKLTQEYHASMYGEKSGKNVTDNAYQTESRSNIFYSTM